MLPAQVQHMLALRNGAPLAIPQHLKKMQPSAPGPQMRISSGGGMRPPSVANSQSSPPQLLQPSSSQSQPTQPASPITNHIPSAPSLVPVPQHSDPNGIGRPAISMPHVEVAKVDMLAASANGAVNGASVLSNKSETNGDAATPTHTRPKSQSQGLVGLPQNGYHYL
jgi:enhancer of polycomb-like protein